MAEPLAQDPEVLQPLDGIEPGPIPDAEALGLAPDACPGRQRGGRSQGLTELESFLWVRGGRYHRELSSPLTAFQGCSRLSAHLAWGTLSLREVVQASRRRGRELRGLPAEQRGEWPRALRGFEERLHWHCHFIQKLEDQPDLEFRSLHPLSETCCPRSPAPGSPVAGMRGKGLGALPSPGPGEEAAEPNGAGSGLDPEAAARLMDWSEGRTGLPFVDACMRCLIATGWLNFRMRAMLLSVACHHLALPWREAGLVLARRFVDYEPGIHWSQCQMQAGSTGINTIRIYNPIKQGQDHDPHGLFLRQWLPELAAVPEPYLHEPWMLPPVLQVEVAFLPGETYPLPIVDPVQAAREARERLWARRNQPGFSTLADAIQRKHGSRRSGLTPTGARRRATKGQRAEQQTPESARGMQLQLDLG